jgi:hypothetical protein
MVAIDSEKWGFLWQASSSLSNQMLPYHRYYHQFTPSIDVTHRTQKYHRKPDVSLCTCIGRGPLNFKLIVILYVKFRFWAVGTHSSFLTQDWGLWDSRTMFYKMRLGSSLVPGDNSPRWVYPVSHMGTWGGCDYSWPTGIILFVPRYPVKGKVAGVGNWPAETLTNTAPH